MKYIIGSIAVAAALFGATATAQAAGDIVSDKDCCAFVEDTFTQAAGEVPNYVNPAGIGTDKDKGEIVKLIVGLARTLIEGGLDLDLNALLHEAIAAISTDGLDAKANDRNIANTTDGTRIVNIGGRGVRLAP